MSRTFRQIAATIFAVAVCTLTVLAAETPVTTNLKFKPQEGVGSDVPVFPEGFTDKTVAIKIVDGRNVKTANQIGEGTGDKDEVFPITTEDSVVQYAKDVLDKVVDQWGMKRGTDRTLTVKIGQFYVTESNKALGSMYSGDVTINYSVADKNGKTLASGTVSGDTKRYGRARSRDNYSEVLSDALKEAYYNMFSEPGLQNGWASGKSSGNAKAVDTRSSSSSSSSSAPCDDLTPEQRMKRLDDMLKKGLITKDEYNTKRAEIVKLL